MSRQRGADNVFQILNDSYFSKYIRTHSTRKQCTLLMNHLSTSGMWRNVTSLDFHFIAPQLYRVIQNVMLWEESRKRKQPICSHILTILLICFHFRKGGQNAATCFIRKQISDDFHVERRAIGKQVLDYGVVASNRTQAISIPGMKQVRRVKTDRTPHEKACNFSVSSAWLFPLAVFCQRPKYQTDNISYVTHHKSIYNCN